MPWLGLRKGALERWAESMAGEIAPFGLGVTVLIAGTYDTDIITDAGTTDERDFDVALAFSVPAHGQQLRLTHGALAHAGGSRRGDAHWRALRGRCGKPGRHRLGSSTAPARRWPRALYALDRSSHRTACARCQRARPDLQ